jgi:repressor LexA
VQIQFVPIIGISAAGNWREAILLPNEMLPMPPGRASKDAFAVEVRGDSMDKLIPDGGFVVVDPAQTELFNGKSYLIQNDEGETTVKAYRSDPARFEPMSSNPEHQAIIVGETRFTVVGRIVWRGAPA